MIDTITNILTAPREAFRALRDRPSFMLPLLVLIVGNCALILWYYNSVDLVWLIESSLDNAGTEMPADAREQMVERVSDTSPMVTGSFAAAASGFVILIVMLLAAAYLSLVSLMTNDGFKFKNWFSLVSWSSFPVVLAVVASMVNLAVSDAAHLPAEELNPLSIASLLALDVREAGFLGRTLQSMDLTSLWALGLMTLGYSTWTGKPLGSSFLIVAGPLLVILAVGVALTLL